MFQAYAIPSMIGLEDPREARDRAHRIALRDAMIAAGCQRSLAATIRSLLPIGRSAGLSGCRA
jgi:hypothetical protein